MFNDFMSDLLGLDPFTGGSHQTKSAPKPTVTVEELIRRKKSHIRIAGKVYRIEATELPSEAVSVKSA